MHSKKVLFWMATFRWSLQLLLNVGFIVWMRFQQRSSRIFSLEMKSQASIEDGLLFNGEHLIVPSNIRKEMIEMVHSSHMGIKGCLRWARDVFYWQRMNAQLKDFILKCDICNTFKPDPSIPWQKVGTDLFLFNVGVNI